MQPLFYCAIMAEARAKYRTEIQQVSSYLREAIMVCLCLGLRIERSVGASSRTGKSIFFETGFHHRETAYPYLSRP